MEKNRVSLTRNKVIVFAVSDDSHFKNPVTKSFKKKGFKVIQFDYRKNSNFERAVSIASRYFPSLKKAVTDLRNKRLINEVKKSGSFYLLVSKGETIDRDTVDKIKKLGVVTINWFSDLIDFIPNMSSILSRYDFVFTHDRDDIYKYQGKINSYYLPYGAPITNLNPSFKNRKINVVFIGAWSKDRERLIYSLRELNPAVWGNKEWQEGKVSQFYKGSWLSPPQVLDVLRESKIAINIHQVPYNIATTLNVRSFEATGSGALLITDRRRDLPKLFKIAGKNREVVSYKNLEEVKNIVEYYLKNEEERITIARRGFRRALKDHNYDNRVSQILSIIAHSAS